MANQIAYGFYDLADQMNATVSTVGVQIMDAAISSSVAEYNGDIETLFKPLVRIGTTKKMVVKLAGSGTLQELDEFGIPLPTKDDVSYEAGFPIRLAGDAWGVSRLTKAKLTVEKANDNMLKTFRKDQNWLTERVLGTLLQNVERDFKDPELGTIKVKPLANGDEATYYRDGGTTASTDTHYLAQAAAISDGANPIPTIYAELSEHPSNEAPYVLFIPTNLRASVFGLTSFIEMGDSAIQAGSGEATIRPLSDSQLMEIKAFGSEVLGRVDKMWVVEWRKLPDNYMIGIALGNATPLLMMRQDETPELQGLFRETHSSDGAREEYRFLRYAGFGVWDRTAAVVYQIGNATYQVPAAYSAFAY